MIGFEVKIDPDELNERIRREARPRIEAALQQAATEAEKRCRYLFHVALISQAEYLALFNPKEGGLMGEFGLSNPETTDRIVDRIKNALVVRPLGVRTRGAGSSLGLGWLGKLLGRESVSDFGGLAVSIFSSDLYDELVDMPEAHYFSDGAKGGYVDWLDWLLLRGTEVVISGWRIDYGMRYGLESSRTGDAVMKRAAGGSYSVPSAFAGTEQNNWITRAAAQAEPEIRNALEQAVKSKLQ